VGEHRLFVGFLNSNLTRLRLKIMNIRLFRYKYTQMTMWRKFPRLLTKTEEEPFWRWWPVRPLGCNVPTNCKRSLECAVDWCDVCLTFSPTSSSSCSFRPLETWLWSPTLPVHLIYSLVTSSFPKPEITAMRMFLGFHFQVVLMCFMKFCDF